MNCETAKTYIMKYFDGERNEIEEIRFRQHLETCASCRDEFNCMNAIFTTLKTNENIDPPADFESMVMDKVTLIEKERREKSSKRIALLYNASTLLSIILLLVFVADLKQVGIFYAFEKIGEYFASFSSVAEEVAGVARTLFELFGDALLAVFDTAISIVKSYYFVFLALLTALFVIQRLLHYIGTYGGRETE